MKNNKHKVKMNETQKTLNEILDENAFQAMAAIIYEYHFFKSKVGVIEAEKHLIESLNECAEYIELQKIV